LAAAERQWGSARHRSVAGVWQHFSIPPSAVNVEALDEGVGFDGSSIRGFQEIQESNMLVVPDPPTAFAVHPSWLHPQPSMSE
jgi:glutamine synthetase